MKAPFPFRFDNNLGWDSDYSRWLLFLTVSNNVHKSTKRLIKEIKSPLLIHFTYLINLLNLLRTGALKAVYNIDL